MEKINVILWVCEDNAFRPVDFSKVRWLDWGDEDYERFRQFCGYPMPRERYAQIREGGYRICAVLEDGKIVASASEFRRSDNCWEVVSVATLPSSQGKGYAKAAISFVTAHILAEGRTATFQTRDDRPAIIHIAASLGYKRAQSGKGSDWSSPHHRTGGTAYGGS